MPQPASSTITLSIPVLPDGVDMLTAALAYAACGWYVLPVKRGAKNPGTVVGDHWQDKSSRDPKQIAAWFAGTDHGIALHCGRSGAVVLDVDRPELIPADWWCHLDTAPFQSTRPDVVGTSVAFPIKGTEFYERVENRLIKDDNWSSRNQNKLLFKGKFPRLYYWFAARWLVKEVNIARMWRMKKRPYARILVESAKVAVARTGVALVDAASFYRSHPKKLASSPRHA